MLLVALACRLKQDKRPTISQSELSRLRGWSSPKRDPKNLGRYVTEAVGANPDGKDSSVVPFIEILNPGQQATYRLVWTPRLDVDASLDELDHWLWPNEHVGVDAKSETKQLAMPGDVSGLLHHNEGPPTSLTRELEREFAGADACGQLVDSNQVAISKASAKVKNIDGSPKLLSAASLKKKGSTPKPWRLIKDFATGTSIGGRTIWNTGRYGVAIIFALAVATISIVYWLGLSNTSAPIPSHIEPSADALGPTQSRLASREELTEHSTPVRIVLDIDSQDSTLSKAALFQQMKKELDFRNHELTRELRERGYAEHLLAAMDVVPQSTEQASAGFQIAANPMLLEIHATATTKADDNGQGKRLFLENFTARLHPTLLSPDYHEVGLSTFTGPLRCGEASSTTLCEQTSPLFNEVLGAPITDRTFHHFKPEVNNSSIRVLDFSLHGELGAFNLPVPNSLWEFSQAEPVSLADLATAINTLYVLRTRFAAELHHDDLSFEPVFSPTLTALRQFVGAPDVGPTLNALRPRARVESETYSQILREFPFTRYANALANLLSAQLLRFELNFIGQAPVYAYSPDIANVQSILSNGPLTLTSFRSRLERACEYGEQLAVQCKLSSAALAHAYGLLPDALDDLLSAARLAPPIQRPRLLHFALIYAELNYAAGALPRERLTSLTHELRHLGAYALFEFETAKINLFLDNDASEAETHLRRVLALVPRHALSRFLLAIVHSDRPTKAASELNTLIDDLDSSPGLDDDAFSLGDADGVRYSVELGEALSIWFAFAHARCDTRAIEDKASHIRSLSSAQLATIRRDAFKNPLRHYTMFPFSQAVTVTILGPCTDRTNPDVKKVLHKQNMENAARAAQIDAE